MGEIADDHYALIFDDFYNRLEFEDDDCYETRLGYIPKPITCKRCKTGGLFWARNDKGLYRILVTATGGLHQCDYSNRVDMFGDESR